ncbi:PDZ domain-containing protein [Carboxydothermus pertinax]|uniref:PDZ domain-containing protein n=1 Tax=Carboxydothermus pertinax TaxID=870242 RepID=A0A1L8CVA4_9THEO|nr:PDZ domain-containing protein [Carboxydothermus pertinax]GAV22817.1 PDZ domain-containing protein [Carboxydothermus pertinax]
MLWLKLAGNTLYTVFLALFENPVFWVVVLIIALQYSRISGKFILSPGVIYDTFKATAHGIVGGMSGSLVLVFLGIALNEAGLSYLWPLAILFMLINPRFLCFSYAGGVVSLAYLIFGFPKVNVAQIAALVGVLHLVESVLISIGGHLGARPEYFKIKTGQIVGGFVLQRFWPIPLAALVVVTQLPQTTGGIQMPDWWPLIKSSETTPNLMYSLIPVVAGLGYGDMVITRYPEEKSKLSAMYLGAYSIILIFLAMLSMKFTVISWFAALFMPLGHEAVIYWGRKLEEGRPLFVNPENGVGVMVLGVNPGSIADSAGLKTGDVILTVNGVYIHSPEELFRELSYSYGMVPLEVSRRGSHRIETLYMKKSFFPADVGIITAPSPYDSYIDLTRKNRGFIGYLWSKIRDLAKKL